MALPTPAYPVELPALLRKYAEGVKAGLFDRDLNDEDRVELARLLYNGADIAVPTTRKAIAAQIDAAVTATTGGPALVRAREIVRGV